MKITNVRAVQPVSETSPPDWRTSIGQILVAVDTDVGITGYGVGGGGLSGIHVIRSVLRDLLLGCDPADTDALWDEMYRATLPFGQKGIAIMALSGVDLALWDVKGKAEQQPIAELLGGKVGQPIPTYVTVWDKVSPKIAASHRAFKLHVENQTDGSTAECVAESVSKARETLGPEPELMIDAWMRWDLETTLDVARRVEEFDLSWIEEPLPVDDENGYKELSERSSVPIAGGEHEFTAAAFSKIVERNLHQVLQPDVCWVGGLTELIKIYNLANKAGVRVCPHRGSEIWGLHAMAALDPNPLAESGRPWMTWVGGQPPIVEGYIELSDRNGFGMIIDENHLKTMWD